jgi:hypothetical protein
MNCSSITAIRRKDRQGRFKIVRRERREESLM